GSELTAAAVAIVYAIVPSTAASSTPVTVTVCGVFQSDAVNLIEAGDTVPSVRSELDNGMVTSAVGCVSSTTVNVALPPASVVARPAVGLTVMPATSLSRLMTDTSDALSLLSSA